jgi:predicted MFS family arabinose efflux permease
MIRDALQIWWLIVPISLVTAGLELFVNLTPEQAQNQSKFGLFISFVIGGLIFGVVTVGVFGWMAGRWPDNAVSIYRWVAFGLTLALTVGAVVMGVVYKNWTAPLLWTVMNLLWGVGYGWVVPLTFS